MAGHFSGNDEDIRFIVWAHTIILLLIENLEILRLEQSKDNITYPIYDQDDIREFRGKLRGITPYPWGCALIPLYTGNFHGANSPYAGYKPVVLAARMFQGVSRTPERIEADMELVCALPNYIEAILNASKR